MNKKISAVLAWEIILAFFVVAVGILWIENQNFRTEKIAANVPVNRLNDSSATKNCAVHAYKGNVEIKGWLVEENQEKFIRVAEKDLINLPMYNGTAEFKNNNLKIKVIDITPQLESKLKKSSKENAVTVPLKGYLTRCQDVPLASINYREGIFRSYL